ncbi:hypothetical protein UK23_30900 [Lentzea aerocolonigenes]|uniref:Tyr recombinase domain-containing protein n=1 Tax=Lentzea aerocolonigenes TaxID=68170 RepID=A0A0F0GRN7_LENAE|nr:hypothetical protein UK23_30900 [Lentzea aerocolonigenes]
MLRHTFVTTMLDAGVELRDVQVAARHADPRTTMRWNRSAARRSGQPSSTTHRARRSLPRSVSTSRGRSGG